MAASLAHVIFGSTGVTAAKVAKPQSVPAMTLLAADDAGVADQALGDELGVLDVVGGGVQHAGDQHLALGSLTSSNSFHSCSWRGLAASNDTACGRAASTRSMMSASGMSVWCGPS